MFFISSISRKSLIFCMTLLMSGLFITKANAQKIIGDINSDLQFSIADVTALVDSLQHGKSPVLAVEDMDGDGKVGKSDVESLVNFLLTKATYAFIAFSTDFECNAINVAAQNSELLIGENKSVTVSGEGNDFVKPGTYLIPVDPKTLNDGLLVTFAKVYDMYSQTDTIKTSVDLEASHIKYLGDYKYSDFVGSSGFMGKGTVSNPYLIHSKDDWKLLASKLYNQSNAVYDAYKGKAYKVVADIDFGGAYLHPIGMDVFFFGTLDGDNHTLSNYKTEVYSTCSGLIAGISGKAVVKNFNVECAGLNSNSDGTTVGVSAFIATVASSNDGGATVDNIHVSGYKGATLTLNNKRWTGMGAVVGVTMGNCTISNCTNDLNITGSAVYTSSTYQISMGGIVGYSQDFDVLGDERYVTINRCRNNANITLTGKQDLSVGGIVGRFKDTTEGNINAVITNCVNSGNINAGKVGETSTWLDDAMAGGIVGWMDSDGGDADPYIYNCLNKGNCYANQCDSWAAGICGYAYDSDTKIKNCASIGSMTADDTDPICAHGSSQEYCHSSDVSGAYMNLNLSKISSDSLPTFCDWTGSQSAGTIDIDLTSNQ